ncbi:hypothetical protein ACKTEK_03165 [Tepidamorphus sp. 3E244]|uniref:hypothetical protein n=1 Tax=Tepidamorphus sp. 3E244 TaxID=3385498 RepID=UPI0038FC1E9B
MGNVIELSQFEVPADKPKRENPAASTAEVIIFPGVRIDYAAVSMDDDPPGPDRSPRRARRRDA